MLSFKTFRRIPIEIRAQGYDAITEYAKEHKLKHMDFKTKRTSNNIDYKIPLKTIMNVKRILKARRSK
jgi:hypothetical protein